MNFVNPIELLELKEFDSDSIKKAKRRKLAEIELSDNGYISHNSNQIDKSALITITEQLQDSDKLKVFYTLSKQRSLTNFLSNGSTDFFESQQIPQELYSHDIINVISVPFASALDNELLNALREHDTYTIKLLSQHPPLITSSDIDKSYSKTSNHLKGLSSELNSLKNRIDNDTSIYNESNCEGVYYTIKSKIHVPTLNALPQHLQGERNDIGQKLRNLSVAVFNSFNDERVSLDISRYALDIKLSGVTKNTVTKDFEEISKIKSERDHNSKYAPVLKKYAEKLLLSRNLLAGIDKSNYGIEKVKSSLKSFLSVDELNGLPNLFQEIRNQIALALRGLAVAVWNKFGDLDYSKLLIGIALKINVDGDIYENLTDAKNQLSDLESDEYKPVIDALTQTNTVLKNIPAGQRIDTYKVKSLLNKLLPDSVLASFGRKGGNTLNDFIVQYIPVISRLDKSYASGRIKVLLDNCSNTDNNYNKILGYYNKIKPSAVTSTITSATNTATNVVSKVWNFIVTLIGWLFIGGIAIAILSAVFDSCDSSSSSNKPSSSYTAPSKKRQTSSKPKKTYTSPYKGNQLSNGSSPYNNCFGSGLYTGNAELTIRNGSNSDAIVCLYNTFTDRTIRNEYVPKGQNFKMTKIPQGYYKIRTMYGRDWNPTIKNNCGTNGDFETAKYFKEHDNTQYFESNSYSYSVFEMTLHEVSGGNARTSRINEGDFFN